ncbi:ribosomal protein S18-alanine N-acetyltransferase [Dokdonella koreensis]|uniref:[Ribosomal protein bS18]-alanine N-acetyltransferase n=1 Tax=Dokdonella koreensis DS-123 TaxID=1300342 RepID=A0A160DXC7_9GAMM|nr:ribosomal protein S18-alanine N-acetyltransferase [Dokdonella koreensis]ANB18931.1 Ribosomal-protein-alanine acetyltransferase [Dokdonella koreensis DS-123]
MSAHPKPTLPDLQPMREQDVEAVAAIEQQAYEFPWSPGIFRDCLRAGYDCRSLVEDGTIIGYAILAVAAGEAHVLNVCVAPARQGRGYGRRLVRRVIDLARWHRAERIFLEVRPSNARAIALYLSLGFNEIGKRPNYYPSRRGREDAIVMAIELLDGS